MQLLDGWQQVHHLLHRVGPHHLYRGGEACRVKREKQTMAGSGRTRNKAGRGALGGGCRGFKFKQQQGAACCQGIAIQRVVATCCTNHCQTLNQMYIADRMLLTNWSKSGQTQVNCWSNTGKCWSSPGQNPSNTGQLLVKQWSNPRWPNRADPAAWVAAGPSDPCLMPTLAPKRAHLCRL